MGLAAVHEFARTLPRGAWFAACGEALTSAEEDEALAYSEALGLPRPKVAGVTSWAEALRIIQSPDWSRAWWNAEEAAQKSLFAAARSRFGEAALLEALSAVTAAAGALDGAAARSGASPPSLALVAAGAAAQACYHAALALAASAGPAHGFAVKYRLFAAGRWPLAIVGGTHFV
ncbi:MAG TPA: hypothetical protein VKT70_07465, partial [Stellaceae bacterium]|nr:hypothetical protein [Stellaceae bacterium]